MGVSKRKWSAGWDAGESDGVVVNVMVAVGIGNLNGGKPAPPPMLHLDSSSGSLIIDYPTLGTQLEQSNVSSGGAACPDGPRSATTGTTLC